MQVPSSNPPLQIASDGYPSPRSQKPMPGRRFTGCAKCCQLSASARENSLSLVFDTPRKVKNIIIYI